MPFTCEGRHDRWMDFSPPASPRFLTTPLAAQAKFSSTAIPQTGVINVGGAIVYPPTDSAEVTALRVDIRPNTDLAGTWAGAGLGHIGFLPETERWRDTVCPDEPLHRSESSVLFDRVAGCFLSSQHWFVRCSKRGDRAYKACSPRSFTLSSGASPRHGWDD